MSEVPSSLDQTQNDEPGEVMNPIDTARSLSLFAYSVDIVAPDIGLSYNSFASAVNCS